MRQCHPLPAITFKRTTGKRAEVSVATVAIEERKEQPQLRRERSSASPDSWLDIPTLLSSSSSSKEEGGRTIERQRRESRRRGRKVAGRKRGLSYGDAVCIDSSVVRHPSRHVKGAGSFGRPTNSVSQSRLACRSSSYMFGSSDLGSLKVQRKGVRTVVSRGPRCEATEGGGQNSKVDVWIGRAAMLGFVTAIGTEIGSGKGVLANLGISTPAPTLALALTAVVGAVLSFGIFRSAAEE